MKEVWLFSFECAGIVKVGGLGEAVYNIAKNLAKRGLNVTLFMPSHGIQLRPETKEKLSLQRIPFLVKGRLTERNLLPYRSVFRYKIGMFKGYLDGFNVVLFSGLDKTSRNILDDEMVYRTDHIDDKALLLARGTSGYIENLKESQQSLPEIIHAHDYHTIPAAVLAKQKTESSNWKPALVLTIHLLSGKKVSWIYLGENWCGIENKIHPVYLNGRKIELSHKQLLRKSKSRLEAFGAMEADVLTSVSQSYLNDEVMKKIGSDCEGKTAFLWNGCDWDKDVMLKESVQKFGDDIKNTLGISEIQRYDLRKYFLTKAIGSLRPEEPILDGDKVKETVESFKDKPFIGKGKIQPFEDDGPMVLMTGRLSKQKGVGILFKAIPRVLEQIPNAKFVLLLLPLEEEISLVKRFLKLASEQPNSVRMILGKAPNIYTLAHLASDIFVCPSEWEPFGIMALEAMATGNPVVATKVGGLQEIIIDARRNLDNGTGILVPKNDYKSLAEAISSLLVAERALEVFRKEGLVRIELLQKMLTSISYDSLKEAIANQPGYGLRLRENAIRRVETAFRWSKVIDMTIQAYEKATKIADFRNP
jgi:starch synthase